MADEPVKTVTETTPVTPVVETKLSKNDILRDMSKEYGVNLFDAEGLKKFKEYQESQKTDHEKMEAQIKAFEEEKTTWQSKKLEYEVKLKASELGIEADKVEDALKLAGNDPEKLADVVKKYPIFKAKGGVKIGIQDPTESKKPTDMTEVEAYMANDPKYKKYLNKK